DFLGLVSEYTRLRKSGKDYVGLCPFHNEKTPSFHVNVELGLFHCFGCGKGGDIITFLREKENLSYKEAIIYLAKRAGIPIPKKEGKTDSEKEQLIEINNLACEFFEKSLYTPSGRPALQYLLSRGLMKKTIELFRLGFAPFTEDALLNFLLDKGFTKDIVMQSGLVKLKGDKLCDAFYGRIIFPIFSQTGTVVGFGGRVFADGDDRPKYLNSPETKLYHKSELLYGFHLTKKGIREKEEAILVEGYMDFLSLYEAGFDNVVASSGTALTPSQASILKRYTDKVVIAYDGDMAGNLATIRAIKIFLNVNITPFILRIPNELDPDSFIHKSGSVSFQSLVSNAPDWFEYLSSIVKRKYPLEDPVNISIWVKKLTPFIAELNDKVSQFAFASKLSKLTGIPHDEINAQLKSGYKTEPIIQTPIPQIPASKKRELLLFYHILYKSEPIEPTKLLSYKDYFTHYPGILELVANELEKGNELTGSKASEFFGDDPDAKKAFAEFAFNRVEIQSVEMLLDEIRKFYLNEKIKRIISALVSARAKGDIDEETRLSKELCEIKKMLTG
ncbi:MAG: DNA primase, partial [bacterium]